MLPAVTAERDRPDRPTRLAIAALGFAVVAPLAYLGQRLFDYAMTGPPDLAAMLRQTVVGYYWRVAIAAWWGGLGAIVLYALAGRSGRADALVRVSAIGALLIGFAFAILAWRFP